MNPPKSDNEVENLAEIEPEKTLEETVEASKSGAELKQWSTIVQGQTVNFNGKDISVIDLNKYVYSMCTLKSDMTIAEIRNKEAELSNLMSLLLLEESKVTYSITALEHHKQKLLAKSIGNNEKRSMSAIDLAHSKNNKEYQQTKDLMLSANLTLEVLQQLYRMCNNATDRLNKISMALMAELKFTRN